MKTLTVNGQTQELAVATVDELLQQLQLAQSQVAVELNGTIVSREAFGDTPLQEGDHLEIVRFVGGG